MKTSVGLKVIVGAALLALPLMASAESSYQTGAGPLTATAHVDFQVRNVLRRRRERIAKFGLGSVQAGMGGIPMTP